MFVICDETNSIVRITGMKLWGVTVIIPAAFIEEQDALGVLFKMEESKAIKEKTCTVRLVDHLMGPK